MPHKKGHSPFDLSNIFPTDNKNFGFTIESSFVDESSQKRKYKKAKTKKYTDERYRAVLSHSIEPASPSEEVYGDYGMNVYGQRKI